MKDAVWGAPRGGGGEEKEQNHEILTKTILSHSQSMEGACHKALAANLPHL